jgi:hypothetical protein
MPRLLDLFSGTGSVGRAFEECGWEVVSVDLEPKFAPTHVADVLKWDYKQYPPGHFDCVHSSPPCTEYSQAMRARPRRLEEADALVRRAREITEYFDPPAFFYENPWTGLLPKRDILADLPRVRIDYCVAGALYKKPTCIWTNTELKESRCPGPGRCPSMRGTRHLQTAQRQKQTGHETDVRVPRTQLYAMPPLLCHAMCAVAERAIEHATSRGAGPTTDRPTE